MCFAAPGFERNSSRPAKVDTPGGGNLLPRARSVRTTMVFFRGFGAFFPGWQPGITTKLLQILHTELVYCVQANRAFHKAIIYGGETTMAGQGRHVSSDNIQRIIYLLATTEMTVTEIAERMSIHKSTISAINKRFQVRRLRSSCSAQGIVKKKSVA